MANNRWLGWHEARPSARVRLFCFPFAGGSASTYRAWSVGLPGFVEVCPIQLPGREDRFCDPAFSRISDLVPVLVNALTPLFDLPFVFYGHSMGSLIAFELAHELRARRQSQPVALFPAAHQAPAVPHQRAICELPDAEVIAHVKKLSNTPQLLDESALLRLILPTLRCDFSLCDTYSYETKPRLTCPVTFFGGREDDMTDEEFIGWGDETTGPFEVEMLPGGHLFLTSSRPQLLESLSRRLSALDCK